MMPAPNFSLSAKDRLWLVLEAHEGHWTTVEDLMFEAGFVPTRSNPLTPYTSFYFNLCQLEDAGPANGFRIGRQAGYVAMCRPEPASSPGRSLSLDGVGETEPDALGLVDHDRLAAESSPEDGG